MKLATDLGLFATDHRTTCLQSNIYIKDTEIIQTKNEHFLVR